MLRALLAVAITLPLAGQIKAPNASGVSMGHIHLLSPDPSQHRSFWVDFLGGEPVSGLGESFKFPGVLVMIRKGDAWGGSDGSAVNHLGFLVSNLEEYVSKAQAKGFQVAPQRPSP